LAEDHELCFGMMTSLSVWVRQLVTLMEDVTLRDAAGRVARFLIALKADDAGTVKWPGLKRYVASHLNLTSETFSRTLRRMVEAGLIEELEKNRIRLIQPKKLRQVAEGLFPKL
jgi:CRP/FNR family transcriptional regulator